MIHNVWVTDDMREYTCISTVHGPNHPHIVRGALEPDAEWKSRIDVFFERSSMQ
jgi:hypothetical protein